ncbi:MAG: FAD:protein FMN transferase [Candidatus Marinimicrobia bacterium]|nr:FAD:protein FMN transferase [Candidatus Neomarinimicrobiota bacterium]
MSLKIQINIYFYFLLNLLLASLFTCESKVTKFTETRFQMGTIVQITVFEKNKETAHKQMDQGFAEIDRIANLFWEGNPDSDIYKFNHRNSDTVEVSAEVAALISRAKQISVNTFGAFDMTIGTLKDLYSFKKGEEKVPDSLIVSETIKNIGFEKLEIDLKRNLLISENQNFTLLTGAIVKGYAAERALQKIVKENHYGVLVNAGGDICASKRSDGQKWLVGVQDPAKKDHLLGTVSIEEGAVVTSGDYEQFSIVNGKKYHHIINPLTGFSADKSHSSTVIAPDAEMADALATGLFVLGAEKGLKALINYPDIECLWVDWEGKHIMSEGFYHYYQAFYANSSLVD